MSHQSFITNFWIPVILGAAFLILSYALQQILDAPWLSAGAFIAALLCFGFAAYLAKRPTKSTAGEGGSAYVRGIASKAKGGDGGVGRGGGKGGDAEVIGDRSTARGGKGGDA